MGSSKNLIQFKLMHSSSNSFSSNNLDCSNKGNLKNYAILLNYSKINENFEFKRLATNYRPNCIIDLRVSPRLEKFAHTRSRAFTLFDENEIKYIDALGILNITSFTDFSKISSNAIEALATSINKIIHNNHPFVCLYDDTEIFNSISNLLNSNLFKNLGATMIENSAEFREGLLLIN